jgi:hypothetical protein
MIKNNFLPVFEKLETKALLTGPIGNPSVIFQGVLQDSSDQYNEITSVGGYVNVKVTAPYGTTLQSVDYEVAHSILYQNYGPMSGTYSTLGSALHNRLTSTLDSLSFYMDEQVLYKNPLTINTVLVNKDSTTVARTMTYYITTTSPTVTKFHVDGNAYKLMYKPANGNTPASIGLQQPSSPLSEVFTAAVNTNLFGGKFTVIQMITGTDEGIDYNTAGQIVKHPKTTFTSTTVDDTSITDMPFFPLTDPLTGQVISHYTSATVPPDSSIIIPNDIPDGLKLADAPHLLAVNSWPNTYTKKLISNLCFQTYLVYSPQTSQQGIWVTLSRIDWQISATATYNGPIGASVPITAYYNPQNWTTIISNPTPWQKDGVVDRRILTWNTNSASQLSIGGF